MSFVTPEIEFKAKLRPCVIGEYQSADMKCVLCPPGFYSVTESSKMCLNCPKGAQCVGGSKLKVNPGYWRENELSDKIWPCPNPDACLGGMNSTCADGYTGPFVNHAVLLVTKLCILALSKTTVRNAKVKYSTM